MFKSILTVLDPATGPEALLDTVADVAKRDAAAVTLMSVPEDLPRIAQRLLPDNLLKWRDQSIKERVAWLDTHAAPLRERGIEVRTQASVGSGPIETIREVLRTGHDVVIKEPSGTASERSPEDHKLLRKCPCPVWLCGSGLPRGRVMAAIELDPDDPVKTALNEKVLRHAAHAARLGGAEVHALHAWAVYGEAMLSSRMQSDEFLAYSKSLETALREDFDTLIARERPENVRVERHLIRGTPQQVIPAFVERESVDLVVMGTVGRSGLPGFLVGNTAEHVLNHIKCDLLAVKPDGFVSPVTVE